MMRLVTQHRDLEAERATVAAPSTLPVTPHVRSAGGPRPRQRVVPSATPPRVVTYDGTEFEVMFDGVADRVIVDEPQ